MAIAAFIATTLMLIINIVFIPIFMSIPPPPDPMYGFMSYIAFFLLAGGLCVNLTAFVIALISAIKTSRRRPFALAALFITTPQLIIELFFTVVIMFNW